VLVKNSINIKFIVSSPGPEVHVMYCHFSQTFGSTGTPDWVKPKTITLVFVASLLISQH